MASIAICKSLCQGKARIEITAVAGTGKGEVLRCGLDQFEIIRL
jgi:hypothetical protein